ncbi:LOW QUALITY PROTEIN: hypothetical protein CVT26_001828 [Gymnopilus dilepis]|uniref:Uncharacterized protein n=1 Tax=Gymnopilus dilepis TaxID=231916 RepID=A0A409VRU7_9AGAR|nr:LOW QUALITY PROTEIN: hypothetical protein CVT26_001828 [Gymnopilus dilepis]
MSARNVYSGPRRKLVLAFDIGTTYSGISYRSDTNHQRGPLFQSLDHSSSLICLDTRYPAQELISGASKIPTIIYYDLAGKVRAVGAEATREGIYEEAEDGEWYKSEWFKLHLRSKFGAGKNITDQIPPLPPKKSVIQVFADFLQYLLECASSYIRETEPNGAELWNSVRDSIDFVLSHPNGWEGKEQSQMRRAAVLASLIPDTTLGHARLSFVTEGEASLHFAVQNGVLASILKQGDGVVIVDAGGGTIDISSYRKSAQGHTYEEIAPPQCHFHGSVFVSIRARIFLQKFLSESDFLDDLDTIVENFDKTTKVRFRNDGDPQYIKFGSTRDNDPHCNIRFGQLKLSGSDVAEFFKPAIACIVEAALSQRTASPHRISHVVLVGGFAASDWLFHGVQKSLSSHALTIVRPENHVATFGVLLQGFSMLTADLFRNKAVSDGAISFYLDHFVRTRNTQVTEQTEFRYPLSEEADSKSKFRDVMAQIWCYRGDIERPRWKDVDSRNFTHLCTIITDLSHLPLKRQVNRRGSPYYQVYFDVVLQFGLTEMKAQVAWLHEYNALSNETFVKPIGCRAKSRGPAKIVYDPDS